MLKVPFPNSFTPKHVPCCRTGSTQHIDHSPCGKSFPLVKLKRDNLSNIKKHGKEQRNLRNQANQTRILPSLSYHKIRRLLDVVFTVS